MRLAQPRWSDTLDMNSLSGLLDPGPESLDTTQSRKAIGAQSEILDGGGSLGQSRDHRRPMRDRFITGHDHRAAQRGRF